MIKIKFFFTDLQNKKEKLNSTPLDSCKKNKAWKDNLFRKNFEDFQKKVLMKIKIINNNSDHKFHNNFCRLKKSRIVSLCKNIIKKIPLAIIVIRLVKKINKIFRFQYVMFNLNRGKHRIIKLDEYVKTKKLFVLKLFNSSKVITPKPTIIPLEDSKFLKSPHDFYNFPSIYIVELCEARIFGKSNFIYKKKNVICHDLYNFKFDYTSEEHYSRHLINKQKTHIHLIKIDKNPKFVMEAATFLDGCSQNYAHWLTEVLPRIAVFCSIKKYDDVPIVIDHSLHSNILESLALVVGSNRNIITLEEGSSLKVKKLHVTSVTGYVPFEQRNKKSLPISHGIFSPTAFNKLIQKIRPFYNCNSQQKLPKKIYLRRVSKIRKLLNYNEIENHLVKKGFVIIEPEKLTFLQQVKIFENADEIIGASGAAFANIIFANPNAQIYILTGKHRAINYWYWQNIACASGKKIHYILGDIKSKNPSAHSDIFVKINAINAMRKLKK